MDDLPCDELLETIRDAMRVTCALDMPNIWIDALCTVQDDYIGGIHTYFLDTPPSLHSHGVESTNTRAWMLQ